MSPEQPTVDQFCHHVAEAARCAATLGVNDFPNPGGPRNFMLDVLAGNADVIIRTRQFVEGG